MNIAKNDDVMIWNIYIFKDTVANHAKMKSEYWTELNALSNGTIFNCQRYQVMQQTPCD